jgi:hypothetical protein
VADLGDRRDLLAHEEAAAVAEVGLHDADRPSAARSKKSFGVKRRSPVAIGTRTFSAIRAIATGSPGWIGSSTKSGAIGAMASMHRRPRRRPSRSGRGSRTGEVDVVADRLADAADQLLDMRTSAPSAAIVVVGVEREPRRA